jgi:predicted transcriptional regulator
MYDRESLYRFLYENSNASGIISLSQGEVAKRIGVSYQQLSGIMKEFVEMGLIDKNGHKFLVVYDPDKIPWDKFKQLRRQYIKSKTQSRT